MCIGVCSNRILKRVCKDKKCTSFVKELSHLENVVKDEEIKSLLKFLIKKYKRKSKDRDEKLNILLQFIREDGHIMASRAELIQMCDELGIDHSDMLIGQMATIIKTEVDRRFNKKGHVSADKMSITLKRFLTLEYDYVLKDKDGKELDWKEDKIETRKAERSKKKKRRKKDATKR